MSSTEQERHQYTGEQRQAATRTKNWEMLDHRAHQETADNVMSSTQRFAPPVNSLKIAREIFRY